MSINRRQFFKTAAAGAVTLAAGSAAASSEEEQAIDCGQAFGVLVDTTVCIGCRKCELACDQQNTRSGRPAREYDDKSVFQDHRRPTPDQFTVVNEFSAPDRDKRWTMKVQCMHCNDPACVSACIVGALRKDPQGPVVYDAWKCIGCRYCMVACPFQIPSYEYDNPLDPEVRKCTFCYERTAGEGKKPACVQICPNEALTFGTRAEMIDAGRSRIMARPDKYVDHIYGEKEIGGTAWVYLAPVEFTNTELPTLNAAAIPPLTEKIQHGIFKSFLPPLALYGLLGLIMHSVRSGEEEETSEEISHE